MDITFLRTATQKEHYPKSRLPKIAFAGRSNVGKSSLINSLLGRKNLARISSRPGRTQALNFFKIDNRWIFVDLPGYGYARAPKRVREAWGTMIEQFLTEDRTLRLAVLILDSRHPPTELDLVMKSYLERFDIRFEVVATKVDKLAGHQRKQALSLACQKMGTIRVIPYSAVTGIGKKQLWRIIREV